MIQIFELIYLYMLGYSLQQIVLFFIIVYVLYFVLMPLGVGIITALALRYGFRAAQLDQAPSWWYVVGSYLLAAGIVFVIAVAFSRVGPHGAANWRDLRVIAGRFLPLKAI